MVTKGYIIYVLSVKRWQSLNASFVKWQIKAFILHISFRIEKDTIGGNEEIRGWDIHFDKCSRSRQ